MDAAVACPFFLSNDRKETGSVPYSTYPTIHSTGERTAKDLLHRTSTAFGPTPVRFYPLGLQLEQTLSFDHSGSELKQN